MNDLPDGWEWVEIADLVSSLANGRSVPDGPVGGYPVLRLTAIRSGTVDVTARKNGDWTAEDARQFKICEGDFLVARGNGSKRLVGRGGIVREGAEAAFPDTMIRIRFDQTRVRPMYAALIWDAPLIRTQIEKAARTTAGIYKISQKDLRKIRIALPGLSEQDRIIDAIEEQFSRLDAGIAALSRARANINRLKSTAMSLVSDGTSSWITLGEIADVVGGVTKDAKKQNDPVFVEVPYLRVANVQRGYLDLGQVTTIRVPSATAQRLRLEPGDVLFNEGGDRDKLGRGWVWDGQVTDCIHQNHVFRARLRDDNYEPKFISMHGNSFGREWFDRNGKQTTNLASLSLTALKSFPVPKISIDAQREIVAEVERRLSILRVIEEETCAALRRAASLRASVLASAFSGKLI